jgi:hypothetical protein
MRNALLWVSTQRVVVISYRRFGTTYRSHLQGSRVQTITTIRCVITQKDAVLNKGENIYSPVVTKSLNLLDVFP